ncbi:hypothetical protein FHT80_002809 [Rhizobium sp. BK226]|uniref:hypothetical protein n=1 Tax=Rhizobium sp. BK226 TaxID=2587075 RepID=UPI0016129BDD|nr:hypothetical protein [Rhizobium sp. BK226]MBB4113483.1 hypothetical protein [Rhizobium sp. BK226]
MEEIKVTFDDWQKLVGKLLIAKRNGEELNGRLKGLGAAIVTSNEGKPVRTWQLVNEKEINEFYPGDRWKIFEIKE